MQITHSLIVQNDKLIQRMVGFLFCTFTVFTAWSYFSTLDSASIAQGTVVVESNRKTIQHLDGGIVSDVYVHEGQYVDAGTPLLQVSDVELINKVRQTTLSWVSHEVQYQRLIAERDEEQQFLPNINIEQYPELASPIQALILNQQSLFQSRMALRLKEQTILSSRIGQSEQKRQFSSQLLIQKEQALLLLKAEIEMHKKLLKDGFTSRLRLLELERSEALLKGDIIGVQSEIESVGSSINELEHQAQAVMKSYQSEIETEISQIRIRLASLDYELRSSTESYDRSIVKSPSSGVVLGLAVHSKGEVIGAGEVLMEIVPDNDHLIVEAVVRPTDIDDIILGQDALVRLSAYDFRTTPMVQGEVFYIDADRVEDTESNQASGYRIKIKLKSTQDLVNAELELMPGMPAEVYVLTKRKRPIDYLLEPLTSSFYRAFRES